MMQAFGCLLAFLFIFVFLFLALMGSAFRFLLGTLFPSFRQRKSPFHTFHSSQTNRQESQSHTTGKEETTQKSTGHDKIIKDNEGEYVDFEEIKD